MLITLRSSGTCLFVCLYIVLYDEWLLLDSSYTLLCVWTLIIDYKLLNIYLLIIVYYLIEYISC